MHQKQQNDNQFSKKQNDIFLQQIRLISNHSNQVQQPLVQNFLNKTHKNKFNNNFDFLIQQNQKNHNQLNLKKRNSQQYQPQKKFQPQLWQQSQNQQWQQSKSQNNWQRSNIVQSQQHWKNNSQEPWFFKHVIKKLNKLLNSQKNNIQNNALNSLEENEIFSVQLGKSNQNNFENVNYYHEIFENNLIKKMRITRQTIDKGLIGI